MCVEGLALFYRRKGLLRKKEAGSLEAPAGLLTPSKAGGREETMIIRSCKTEDGNKVLGCGWRRPKR